MSETSNLHKVAVSLTVAELCQDIELELITGDGEQIIRFVAPPIMAKKDSLVLITSQSYLDALMGREGLICIVSADLADNASDQLVGCTILQSNTPKLDFISCLNKLFPSVPLEAGIDSTAKISPNAVIAPDAKIGAFVSIGDDCDIGSGCVIESGSVLTKQVKLGAHCYISAHTHLCFADIDENVQISSHSTIGKRGFGFEGQGQFAQTQKHLGQVKIGKGCDIGASVTIDRGVLDNTVIGDYVRIDNQCHIAHNVQIGDNCIILGQVGIAGSAVIGKNCILGGQVGVADHIHIVDDCIFTSKSGVTKDISQAGIYSGFPAMPSREYWKDMASLRQLISANKKS